MDETDVLTDALAWLQDAPKDDRLYEISFGRYAADTSTPRGCYWSMKLVTEVHSGEVRPSPEDINKKVRTIVAAWRKEYYPEPAEDRTP
jgi:hypothetical protein